MYKHILSIIGTLLLLSCSNNPKNKVTYYEQHDFCKEMTLLDSLMNINSLNFSNDNDFDLSQALKMHHLCSVEMCKFEIENGKNAEMKQIANRILVNDSNELKLIDTFLQSYSLQKTNTANSIDYKIKRAIDKMHHSAELMLINDNDDHDFGILIMPQRQCNADLSELIIHYSKSPILQQIASNIQLGENIHIELLQLWLLKNHTKN